MRAYYNEIEPFAAQWLRNLIEAGHIADGDVDERSIEDVKPSDLNGYTQCHFFAGIGVWSHALRLAGWPDDRPVWTGSCPCQPFSSAGKRKGVSDERHLWPAWFHLIEQSKPPIVLGEQVASKDGITWLATVQSDMEGQGYAFAPLVLPACGFGAPHKRDRIFFAANSDGTGRSRLEPSQNTREHGYWGRCGQEDMQQIFDAPFESGDSWPQPILRKMDARIATRVGRLRAYGNAIHAQTAQAFIDSYIQYKAK